MIEQGTFKKVGDLSTKIVEIDNFIEALSKNGRGLLISENKKVILKKFRFGHSDSIEFKLDREMEDDLINVLKAKKLRIEQEIDVLVKNWGKN